MTKEDVIVTKIVAQCDPCQRVKNAPYRFRVTLGQEHTRFNSKVYMDLMHIEGDYVLHLVDEATRFSAAKFLGKRVTTEKVWEAFIQCWSSVYTGMLHTIAVDEGTQHSDIFGELSKIYDIDVQKSGTESHNSLGIGERYHDTLRKTFLKLPEDHPNLKKDILLAIAIKAINDTLGPEGIVLSALVFGEFPSIRAFIGPKVPHATPSREGNCSSRSTQAYVKALGTSKD